MSTVRCLLMMLLLGGVTYTPAAGAEPVAATWEQVVHELSVQLAAADQTAAGTLLESIPLHTFGTDAPARPLALLAQTSASRIISARAYSEMPTNAARNLADDFAASNLPESIKQLFIPIDADQARHADQLAAQWLRDALRLVRPAPVAMLVLWRGDQALPSLASSDYKRHIIFVMVRGATDRDGNVRPAAIVFGNPLRGG